MTVIDIWALKPGDFIRTDGDSIAEVLRPSEDGEWVKVRYVASQYADIVGTEDLCSVGEIAPTCGAIASNSDGQALWCVLAPQHAGEHVWRNIDCQHTEEDERAGRCEHDHDATSS